MRINNLLVIILLSIFLSGCAGVGVIETSDPMRKLNDAENLFMEQQRPLIAERLIREAIVILKNKKNNLWLGHANQEYGDLLLSQSVNKWHKYYRKNGFLDITVTYENRETKAKQYYKKALEYYYKAEKELKPTNKYDYLTNLYFNMGWSYYKIGEKTASCNYYDLSYKAYKENIKQTPKQHLSPRSNSFIDILESRKHIAGCGKDV